MTSLCEVKEQLNKGPLTKRAKHGQIIQPEVVAFLSA